MHLVGYLYEDYHDARSLEHKVYNTSFKVSSLRVSPLSRCKIVGCAPEEKQHTIYEASQSAHTEYQGLKSRSH